MNTITKSKRNLRYITKTAILAAVAALLMLLEIPLPFAPSFYKLDFSEMVVLMGSFAMGPLSGVLIELIKNLIKAIVFGSSSAYVGEIANFIIGCSFVLPAAFIYKHNKSKKGSIIGMAVGILTLIAVGSIFNYYVLIPAFSAIYGMPIEAIVSMATEINPSITDLKTLIVLAVVPFNLLKGILCSALTLLIYKRISKVLHF